MLILSQLRGGDPELGLQTQLWEDFQEFLKSSKVTKRRSQSLFRLDIDK